MPAITQWLGSCWRIPPRGISCCAFYNWKKKYSGMGVTDVRELRQLREENAMLKRLVAHLSLDKHILQEVLSRAPPSPVLLPQFPIPPRRTIGVPPLRRHSPASNPKSPGSKPDGRAIHRCESLRTQPHSDPAPLPMNPQPSKSGKRHKWTRRQIAMLGTIP